MTRTIVPGPRLARALAALPVPAVLLLAGCGGGDTAIDPSNAPPSRAMAAWTPGPGDTCTQEVHDRYVTVGPDGKLYPTWHPPVDPATGCSFGHEHGRDPRGSDLWDDVGPIPFGYANEQLDVFDPANPRHEDHVGHKVEWENDLELEARGAGSQLFRVRCDVLTKLHQGTHSKDAFANNVHELVYALRCGDGTSMHVTLLSAIGRPGEFRRSCDRDVVIQAGPAVPANSPNGGGFRAIPDRACLEQDILVPAGQNSSYGALNETWETSNSIRTADGRELVFFNPYYQVRLPSRYYHPDLAPAVGRTVDACYEVEANGDRAAGGACAQTTADGAVTDVTWDDPRSRFDGVRRVVDVNANRVRNAGGPDVWYTNPYGREGRAEPFPGSVRQRIGSRDGEIGVDVNGPVIGNGRDYGGPGVHAPN